METPGLGLMEILLICGACMVPVIAVIGIAGALWWMNSQSKKNAPPPSNS